MAAAELTVVKIGGSVLNGLPAYTAAASFLAREAASGHTKLVAVVSAEYGHTDALAKEATAVAGQPDAAIQDLLWSTGELRSVALLTLALKQAGVSATGLNAHETGLRVAQAGGSIALNDISLRASLARHTVVVVPGFLATRRQQLVTLGRGGSDLSAVVLASALRAGRCVLIKDVDGYFTDDPATNSDAEAIAAIDYARAIAMADDGCPLVQRDALIAAHNAKVPLVVRSFSGTGTLVTSNSGRAAVPAVA
ncbi:MAG TPA: hypothetical protein VN700_07105 [Vicinamibacterales bacterium]|nr:hypothetical protein [Vicinamibacterales bacterium]